MTPNDIHILLVDDERDILEILDYNLSKAGYQISTAGNGLEALESVEKAIPDLIILDLMMPGMDGIETCKKLRTLPGLQNTIIVFLTALGEDDSEMAGYHAGADDYITKPIRPKVLLSKIKALLRRLKSNPKQTINIGELSIHLEEHQVRFKGKDLDLPKKEFKLIALLAGHPNKVFSRAEILEKVWGKDVVVGDRTIDVHIRKLREKIHQDKIKTIKGVGYKYVE